MHVRTLAALLATAALAAGCGQAAGGGAGSGRSTQPPPSTGPATVTISGILVATTSSRQAFRDCPRFPAYSGIAQSVQAVSRTGTPGLAQRPGA